MIGELANHLWQSTIFAAVVGLLTLLVRQNHARVCYWLWLTASVKFLIPCALLTTLGSHAVSAPSTPHRLAPAIATVALVNEPFPDDILTSSTSRPSGRGMPVARTVVVTVWGLGFAAIVFMRIQLWLRVRRVRRDSRPTEIPGIVIPAAVDVRSAPGVMEPAVVGIFRPLLLLPLGIQDYLSPRQLHPVIAHELCHVRRRDNFTATIHMAVEAVFWFHPLIWWIGARLLDTRERACDEDVLCDVGDPEAYAEGILMVCKRYVEAPLVCVSGITGANLERRVEAILANSTRLGLNAPKKCALVCAVASAFFVPVVAGAVARRSATLAERLIFHAQASAATPTLEVASVRPNTSGGGSMSMGWLPGGRFSAVNAPLLLLIQSAFDFRGSQLVGVPDWAASERFDIAAKVDADVGPEQRSQVLQALLRDRFQLSVHRELRELPIYALVVARTDRRLGPDLRTSTIDCSPEARSTRPPTRGAGSSQPVGIPSRPACGSFASDSSLTAGGITMSALASSLTRRVDRIVVDRTELDGLFDVDLQWAPVTAASVDGPSIFAAVREQLGLRLEPARGPVEILVVESLERPSPN